MQFEVGGDDSFCFVLCASPDDAANFGTYFPMMPGAGLHEDEAAADGLFLLRFVTLADPFWIYYVSSNPDSDELQAKLQLPAWQSQWPRLQAVDDLDLDAQNGLSMWGTLPEIPGMEDLLSFLNMDAVQNVVKAQVGYRGWLPAVDR